VIVSVECVYSFRKYEHNCTIYKVNNINEGFGYTMILFLQFL
jgi:hypothetical protein